MPTNRAITRKESAVYAQALLEATQGSGTVFDVAGQLEQVNALIRGNIELRTTLFDRTIPAEARIGVVNEVLSGFDPALLGALGVMIKRDDLGLLGKVCNNYAELAESALNAVFIDVTTVVPLDDALRNSIKTKYSAQFGCDVLLREHIDPEIMGGIVLSSRGVSIDGSVVSQLENARVTLGQAR
ncbi:MAG: ATP synthase F1 subunit delta [Coriobacteriia bacterium]|jgi:F-type H+-transporting ATPase subunit delta|nr:ATP synthase F1 subunit delta [Coriobacteriia bacterium]MDR2714047.1 ATP synthase F1 subunit delta [Coriobacteriales bacterium]